jgi:hypothetical protein
MLLERASMPLERGLTGAAKNEFRISAEGA